MIWLGLFIAVIVLILGGWYLYNQQLATQAQNNPLNQAFNLVGGLAGA